MLFRNWKGEMVPPPADHPTTVVATPDKAIVWSYATREEKPKIGPERHRVRYCLQVQTFASARSAAAFFTNCMSHKLETEGLA